MRDVAEQPALGGDEGVEALGHPIEVAAELRELVGAVAHSGPDAHGEVAARQRTGRAPEDRQRPGHVAGQPVARGGRRREHRQEAKRLRRRPIVKQPHQADRQRRHQDVAAPLVHGHRAP